MIYNSFNFLVVFPLIFLLYYAIPAKYKKGRNAFLLIVSYLLYINWKPIYALVLLGVTIGTFVFARLMTKTVYRKRLVWIGTLVTVFPLLFFKYSDFINQQVFSVLSFVGLRYELSGLNWAIPVGISFFTFQALGYMLDVYYGRIDAEKDFLTYALFVSFFPSILAGPINKASLLIPQLKSLRPYFDYAKAVDGLKMLLWGMFMKVVVADRVALYVDTIYSNYLNYTGVTCLVASILYSIQIYADFAGYSLMAIGVGKVLGFDLSENFRRPYFSVSVTEFWHRWHISLSTWLKDYVYIPLGGSRCSKLRNYWNIFVTFLVSGIWHGANWTFIVWGCIHGLCQIIEKALNLSKWKGGNEWLRIGRVLITFMIVSFAWVFFRMPSLADAVGIIARVFDFSLPISVYWGGFTNVGFISFGLFMLLIKDISDEFYPSNLQIIKKNRAIRWFSYLIVIIAILLAGVFGADQFIYANF